MQRRPWSLKKKLLSTQVQMKVNMSAKALKTSAKILFRSHTTYTQLFGGKVSLRHHPLEPQGDNGTHASLDINLRSYSSLPLCPLVYRDIALSSLFPVTCNPQQGESWRFRRYPVCKEAEAFPKTGRLQSALQQYIVQCAQIVCLTGNGKKLNNSQACCLAQLCLAAAQFIQFPVLHHVAALYFMCSRQLR